MNSADTGQIPPKPATVSSKATSAPDSHSTLESIPAALREDMERKSIDVALTASILGDYNSGRQDSLKPVKASGVPAIDGKIVIDTRCRHDDKAYIFSIDEEKARTNLARFDLVMPETTSLRRTNANHRKALFTAKALEEIGNALLPFTAYGVLNGGSATSYADSKKNLALGPGVFDALSGPFQKMAPLCRNRPKGLTPAYINPDGSAGASFLELKMRARLLRFDGLQKCKNRQALPMREAEFMPLFQMTSSGNDAQLAEAYASMAGAPFLESLAGRLGISATKWHTGVQSMIAAFTHSSEGRPKRIFDRAYGKENSSVALPGGHGQCFRILAPVFRKLYEQGTRFAYIGNVDNIGYTPDPLEIAILALSGAPAGFEFSVRTPMDVKGGILIQTEEGGCTVADIGPAISFDEVLRLENSGYSILFNCAVGLFDLSYLVPHLDEIARALPVRFTDQDKDAGRYSQAEQVTWEVLSCLPSFLAFAVDKNERFLAAKLLVDTLLTSGVAIDDSRLPQDLRETVLGLNKGLKNLLGGTYGLVLSDNKWVPQESVRR
ncbi:MAG: UTP--glucose-1-phosphate uridylyltransferase [Spirochaetaceae bacterium]|nr:UTP--glucose-1-phosphate uridylyltransferase [Spirochaetaceae bacterium]